MAAIDEYKKFLASKPEAQREYRTLEFYHVDFASSLRFVKDFKNISLTLESDAPRNASTSVEFTAIAMDVTEPGENQEADQILTITLGATNDEIQGLVDSITVANRFEPIECIYRKYYSGDLSEPVLTLRLSVSNVSFEGYTRNRITAEDRDLANKSSGEIYTIERFATLSGV